MPDIYKWNTTAANNATADPDIDWQEGQFPRTVNDSARQMMAGLAHFRNDLSSTLTTGGTGDAYTVTPTSPPSSLSNGWIGLVRFDRANTGAATMQVGGLPATPASLVDAEGNALPAGFIAANGVYLVAYNSTTGNFHVVSKVDNSNVVEGPASATDGNIAVFDGATGKLIRDSGFASSGLIASPGTSVAGNIAAFNDATGSSLIDAGLSYSGLWHDSNFASKIAALAQNTAPAGTESVACDDGRRVALNDIAGMAAPDFISGEVALSANYGVITAAHGLASVPKRVECCLICVNPENGFAAGERVFVNSSASYYEQTLWADATNVGLSVYGGPAATDKNASGNNYVFTAGNWNVQFFAWL